MNTDNYLLIHIKDNIVILVINKVELTFEGPSLIFFSWSLYFRSSASNLPIFFSMDSALASTWRRKVKQFRAITGLKCPACGCKRTTRGVINLSLVTVWTRLRVFIYCSSQLGFAALCNHASSVTTPLGHIQRHKQRCTSAWQHSRCRYIPTDSEEASWTFRVRISCAFSKSGS